MTDESTLPVPRDAPLARPIGLWILDPLSGETVFVPAVLDRGPYLRAPTMEPKSSLAVMVSDALGGGASEVLSSGHDDTCPDP